jgi:hypothetical protein
VVWLLIKYKPLINGAAKHAKYRQIELSEQAVTRHRAGLLTLARANASNSRR